MSDLKVRLEPGLPQIVPYPMPTEAGLPANTAHWIARPERAVLLIHDMQEFFLRPFPGGESPRSELLAHAISLRRRCADLGVPVAYTAQPGGMSRSERGLLQDFWGPGMRGEPSDRQVLGELAPAPDDWMFTKWRYSAFHRTSLLAEMQRAGRDQLIICGVYAHVGVLMTACDAFSCDIETFVAADAIADFSLEHHRMALEYAAARCAVVRSTGSLLLELGTGEDAR